MIRTAVISSILMTCSIVHADDREVQLGLEQEYLHHIDPSMSRQEYEGISKRNRRYVLDNLSSYSENTLVTIGMPASGIKVLGAALDFALDGSRLNLYKSKVVSLTLKDVKESDRALYLDVGFDW
jgi:hypothetical protein